MAREWLGDRRDVLPVAFTGPADAGFRVAMHRLVAAPVPARRLSQARLFTFV
ncbi:hypothetical protein [Micromonospora sp. NPDC047134]|uniref:hypothetical protein n=1 Tax=Micromonospora sp. NPDC047134 TaxID=3154340 RepID=UPI0033F5B343